jgi:hypothetical protein
VEINIGQQKAIFDETICPGCKSNNVEISLYLASNALRKGNDDLLFTVSLQRVYLLCHDCYLMFDDKKGYLENLRKKLCDNFGLYNGGLPETEDINRNLKGMTLIRMENPDQGNDSAIPLKKTTTKRGNSARMTLKNNK